MSSHSSVSRTLSHRSGVGVLSRPGPRHRVSPGRGAVPGQRSRWHCKRSSCPSAEAFVSSIRRPAALLYTHAGRQSPAMLCGIDDNPAVTEEQGTRAFKINFISFEHQETCLPQEDIWPE